MNFKNTWKCIKMHLYFENKPRAHDIYDCISDCYKDLLNKNINKIHFCIVLLTK